MLSKHCYPVDLEGALANYCGACGRQFPSDANCGRPQKKGDGGQYCPNRITWRDTTSKSSGTVNSIPVTINGVYLLGQLVAVYLLYQGGTGELIDQRAWRRQPDPPEYLGIIVLIFYLTSLPIAMLLNLFAKRFLPKDQRGFSITLHKKRGPVWYRGFWNVWFLVWIFSAIVYLVYMGQFFK